MTQWQEVLEMMVRERRPALVGYACLFAANRRDAEDLVQEALVRTFSRTRAVTDPGSAEAYVRKAIRTSYLDSARKTAKWWARAHLFSDPQSSRGPEQEVTASVDVRAALARLSPRERACVVLRYFDDLPVAEIAAELGVGAGTVKRYVSDGTTKLRDSLGVDVPGQDGPDEWSSITSLGGRSLP